MRHLTVVRTSNLFGHVTKPAPAPVSIEKLQEEAQKVSGETLLLLLVTLSSELKFSNSLIIHQVETKKTTSVKEVDTWS